MLGGGEALLFSLALLFGLLALAPKDGDGHPSDFTTGCAALAALLFGIGAVLR